MKDQISMNQRRSNSFSTTRMLNAKKRKFSPNTSFTIYNNNNNDTITAIQANDILKKPIWNYSTRPSSIIMYPESNTLNNNNGSGARDSSRETFAVGDRWRPPVKRTTSSTPSKNKTTRKGGSTSSLRTTTASNNKTPTTTNRQKRNSISSLATPTITIATTTAASKEEKTNNGRQRRDSLPAMKIYTIWSQKLAKDQLTAEAAWNRCRIITVEAVEKFSDRLAHLESIVRDEMNGGHLLDLTSVEERKKEIETILFDMEEYDVEMREVSKAMQNVSQYLPPVEERDNLKNSILDIRKRYFKVLQDCARQKEIFRWLVPLLQQYKEHGSDIKTWLDVTETRSEIFTRDFNNNDVILQNEDMIESIREELFIEKEVYEDFLEASESIMDLLLENENLDEMRQDHDHVVERWDTLCSNIEKCFNRLFVAKKAAMEKSCKTDPERIEKKIRTEAKQCTCHNPFQIIKVGEGKYTFGTSKIVRLLRVHGNSIVVRVGGGWEYLYDFLFKADPCRAKQALESNSREMKSLDLSGLDLLHVDKSNSKFSLNVQRMTPKSWTPYRNRNDRSGSLGSAASSTDNMDCDESSDSFGLSTSTGPSTPIARPSSRTGFTSSGRKNSRSSSKMLGSLDNVSASNNNSKERLSLVERQAIYTEKKKMAQAF